MMFTFAHIRLIGMIRYILYRLLSGFVSIIMVAIIISAIIYHAPVDPARMSFDQRSDEATIKIYKQKYYLDQPFYIQTWKYFEDLSPIQYVHNSDIRISDYSFCKIISLGDDQIIVKKPYFRKSFVNGRSVWNQIMEAMPGTLVLACLAILFAIVIGLPLGVMAALNLNSLTDKIISVFCSVSYAIPSYVSALFFGIIFAYYLGEYTHLPLQGSLWDFNDMGDEGIYPSHLILPVLALGIRPISMIAQMTRSAVLDVLSSDYIRTSRAKGLSPLKVIVIHVLPNSINPILTTISSWFASLLTGSFFVEFIFNYKGIGLLTIGALNQFDIPLILGCSLVTVCLFVLVNTLTDIAYSYFDPRIKLS